ncbi:MAG: TonB-dependent receptor [Sphingorhabdus sp.]|nr:TonB-dependent receptor [Novosphingobium sp.]
MTPNFANRKALMRLLLATIAAFPTVPALAQTQPSAQSGEPKDQDIVVTARKREELLQDVPISVAALSGSQLAQQGLSDTAELATAVPGISIQDGGPGYRAVFIRGVASERGNAATTGFYIDEAPAQPGGTVQSIVEPLYFDVARVEVLRGPQGTLFGGSSMGGTIRIINNAPDTRKFAAAFGGDLSSTQDGGINEQVSGMVNLPIAPDTAALRLAASFRHHDGFIDKIVAPGGFSGPDRDSVGPTQLFENVNSDKSLTLRGALLLKLGDAVEITPSVFHQNTHGGVGAMDLPPKAGDQRRMVVADEYLRDKVTIANLLVKVDLGSVELLSSSTLNWRRSSFSEDGSDYLRETFLPSVGLPRVAVIGNFDGTGRENEFTQEIRLTSTGSGPLGFVLGGFYENRRASGTSLVQSSDLLVKFPIAAFYYPTGVLFSSASEGQRKHYALFGELNYNLTDKLSLSAGLRYYDYKLTSTQLNPTATTRSAENGFSPRFSLSYKLSDGNLVYATVSRGFRPGGPGRRLTPLFAARCQAQYAAAGIGIDANGNVDPYDADSLWNYEVGVKTQTADRRLTFNAAAYAIEWKNIQQLYFPSCGAASTQNFGSARIRGIEADFNAALTDQFSLFGGININSSKIAHDVPELGVTAGTELQNTPRFTANINARFAFDGPFGSDAYVLGNVRHVGSSYRDFDRTNPLKFQDKYTLVGLRAGMDLGKVDITLYVDNLFNQAPMISNFLSSFGLIPSRERGFTVQPRTVGASVRIDF